uniref:Exonuclease 1 n=1 Tax=Panagrolaimus sp. ES5 TaxID=591445 RepID=A0AC34FUM2_9BILA
MGIKGLLSFVASASRTGDIAEFKGKTIAIDTSCLLHRSFTGCAIEVAEGKRSHMYVNFIRRYVDLLLNQDCHVILVFDGQPLPAKKNVNDKRKLGRLRNRQLGRICLQNGDRTQGYKHYQAATGITADVVEHVIEEFRNIPNVDIIVAPYEADAQLAYLIKTGIADAIVTEDSDLVPFGCETIIFKLNLNSRCVVYEKRLLYKCMNRGSPSKFNFDVFRRICIMSGCDYFPEGFPKVGLVKAVEVFARSIFSSDFSKIVTLLRKVPRYLSIRNFTVTDRMIRTFIEAEYTFLHQIVFDPITRSHIPLYEYSSNIPPEVEQFLKYKPEPFWFAGKALPAEDAFRQAIGNSDLKVADKFTLNNPPDWSIYHPDLVKRLQKREPSVQPIDSGYSSHISEPSSYDDGVVPATPEDPFRDSPVPEELERAINVCAARKLEESKKLATPSSRFQKISISSTPTTPTDAVSRSLNRSTTSMKRSSTLNASMNCSTTGHVTSKQPSTEKVSLKKVSNENLLMHCSTTESILMKCSSALNASFNPSKSGHVSSKPSSAQNVSFKETLKENVSMNSVTEKILLQCDSALNGSINRSSTEMEVTNDGFVPATPDDSFVDDLSVNESTASAQNESVPSAITPDPFADLPLKHPSPVKQKPTVKQTTTFSRSFDFRSPPTLRKRVEVVNVVSRHGPSPQINEFKTRRSMNGGSSISKPSNAFSTFMSPRAVKRPLNEISGNEFLKRSSEKPGLSSVRTPRAPQKPPAKSTKSNPSRFSEGLSPRLFKSTFPTVEFPKKK